MTAIAILVLAAIVALFAASRSKKDKPRLKVIERIIERPYRMSMRDRNDDTRHSNDKKEEKPAKEKPVKEKPVEEKKPEEKPEEKPNPEAK